MKAQTLTDAELAAAMGCNHASAVSRLVALGYTKACGRCGGCGRYSWNQMHGDRCFGCGGAGKRLDKITAKVVAEALARIAAGELASYFAEHAARREIKAADKALWTSYMATSLGKEYTKASVAAQATEQIDALLASPLYRAQTLMNQIMDRASNAMYAKKAPFVERIATIHAARAAVIAIDLAWRAWCESAAPQSVAA